MSLQNIWREVKTNRFQHLLRKHGGSAQALGWSCTASQRRNFEVLTDAIDFAGVRLADIGCGRGDLLGFLKESEIEPAKYFAVDIVAPFLAEVRKRYCDAICLDSIRQLGSCDWAVAVGTFGFNHPQWSSEFFQMITEMWMVSAIGIAYTLTIENGETRPKTSKVVTRRFARMTAPGDRPEFIEYKNGAAMLIVSRKRWNITN